MQHDGEHARERIDRLRTALAARAPRRRAPEPGPGPTTTTTTAAAVAAVIVPSQRGGLDLLLIRRAEHPRDPWSGHMALPGGRADAGDADLLATAMRETEEEVGLALARTDLLGELDEVGPHAGSTLRVTVRPFVFALAGRTGLRPSEEVAEALWVGVDALRDGACETELLVRGELRRVDAYRVEQRLVWGMTQRILASLLALA